MAERNLFPVNLVRSISSGRCLLFVGAGLSKLAHDLPTWFEFIDKLRRELPEDLEESGATREMVEKYHLEFIEYVKNNYAPQYSAMVNKMLSHPPGAGLPGNLHKTLFKLPWAAIITTNLDCAIEDAYYELGREVTIIKSEEEISRVGLSHNPTIIKMHGSVGTGSQVLTQSEYLDFDTKSYAMRAMILSLFSQYPLLILGAGLSDPNFIKLYSIAHSVLGSFKHKAYYISNGVPKFLESVWGKRGMTFIDVKPYKLERWVINLEARTSTLRVDLNSKASATAVSIFAKERALEYLAEALNDYNELQQRYVWTIQISDYGWFTKPWEETLYIPLRTWIRKLLSVNNNITLGYCAPGPHAPALICGDTMINRLSKIYIYDICSEVVEKAREIIFDRISNERKTEVIGRILDLSGGAGIALSKFYSKLIELPSLEEMVKELNKQDNIDKILSEINLNDSLYEGELLDVIYSEMVASFTGTPPLIALRTKLFKMYSKEQDQKIQNVLSAASRFWRKYNDVVYPKHIKLLRSLTKLNGIIAVAVDTSKIYDDGTIEKSFSKGLPSVTDGVERIEMINPIEWRDHESEFIVKISGRDVNDFKAHKHSVELVAYKVVSK